MTTRSPRWLGFGPIALLMACAQAGPAAGGSEAPAAGDVGPPKTIVIAQLAPTTSFGPWQFSNTGGGQAPLVELHTQGLTGEDSEGRTTPRLIAKMPSFEDGTVTVLADGRMRTTWRLRSDVTWQDGVPFNGEDVVFSYAMNKLPELPPASSNLVPSMDSVEAPDPTTVVITWKSTYYQALELTHRAFWMYPKHLLGPAMDTKEDLSHHPYFTTAYLHLGPFRLVEWGQGESMLFERYDGYFQGRPKLDKIVIRVISNTNSVLASLHSGDIDLLPGKTLSNDVYADLARELEASRQGVVARAPDNWRYIWFQFDPRWARPIELSQDVRLRRGLLLGLDRPSIRELVHPGMPEADVDSFLAINDPRNSVVGQPFAPYRHDPSRALQTWAEGGWERAADGRLLNRAGQTVPLEIRGTEQEARQIAAVAAGWRQFGLDAHEAVTPPALSRDSEWKATFPAMESRGRGSGETVFTSFDSRESALPENRWVGANNGHYDNPVLNGLIDDMYRSLDSSARTAKMKEAGQILADDLPAIPLYYGMMFMVVRSTLNGVAAHDFEHMGDSSGSSMSRNAHLWDRA
ncbi:MAG TPA: ABC transporter substrate-binding protein [Chloroflexota bacterium]